MCLKKHMDNLQLIKLMIGEKEVLIKCTLAPSIMSENITHASGWTKKKQIPTYHTSHIAKKMLGRQA